MELHTTYANHVEPWGHGCSVDDHGTAEVLSVEWLDVITCGFFGELGYLFDVIARAESDWLEG